MNRKDKRRSPRPHRHAWREHVTAIYRDARDARDALRESEPYLQHEPEDFNREHPWLSFKAVLQNEEGRGPWPTSR